MAKINKNYARIKHNTVFVEISRRVEEYKKNNPDKKIYKLGIGDITKPLAKCVVDEMKKAVDEMLDINTLKGYGPEKGYDF